MWKKIFRKYKYSFLFIVGIIALVVFFHYPVHIEDAVTEGVVPEYGISISPLRILLEPLVGPLLYSLRGDQPLVEFLAAMLWVMVLLLVAFLFKKKAQRTLTIIGKWLAVLPLVLGLWTALVLVLVFAPLPTNKIVNPYPDKILVNIHSHTHYSHDGIIAPEDLMKWHRKNGFDAFFLTEHNHHNKTLELVQAQHNYQVPQNPLVIAGQEYSGSNHILLLGLKRDFKTKDMPDSTAIDSARANDGVAVVAHWFAHGKNSVQHYIDQGAEGFEVINQAEGITYDRHVFHDIVDTCQKLDLLLLGSCDYHGYGSVALSWNALEIPGWHKMGLDRKTESIINILKNHDQDKIQVLAYRDRTLFSRDFVLLSPLINFIGYFRSLNFFQLFFWTIWIFIFRLLGLFRDRISLHKLKTWTIIGIVSSLLTAFKGFHLLSKVGPLTGYNEIYTEYGHYFLWIGLILITYSILLFLVPSLRLANE